MLRAVQQQSWHAILDKFSRGLQDSDSNASRRGGDSAGQAMDEVVWTHFSGAHLRCTVLSTKMVQGCGSSNKGGTTSQLRVIVTCGPTGLNDTGGSTEIRQGELAALTSSFSQTCATSLLASTHPQLQIEAADVKDERRRTNMMIALTPHELCREMWT